MCISTDLPTGQSTDEPVQRMVMSMNPRPSHVEVPASRGLPDNSRAEPIRPTILRVISDRDSAMIQVGAHPRIKSETTRDWTIRCRVVPGLPLCSRYAIVAKIAVAPMMVRLCQTGQSSPRLLVDTILTRIVVDTIVTQVRSSDATVKFASTMPSLASSCGGTRRRISPATVSTGGRPKSYMAAVVDASCVGMQSGV